MKSFFPDPKILIGFDREKQNDGMKKWAALTSAHLRLSVLAGFFFFTFQISAITDTASLAGVVRSWCSAINGWRLDSLAVLYGDTVLYYGSEISSQQCIKDKMKYMSPFDAFRLEKPMSIKVTQQTEHIYRCDFNKKYKYKGERYTYPSYLLIYDDGFKMEIVGESDLVTDRNLAFHLEKSTFLQRTEVLRASSMPQMSTILWIFGTFSLLAVLYWMKKYRWRTLSFSSSSTGVPSSESTSTQANSQQFTHAVEKVKIQPTGNLANVYKGRDFENFVVRKFIRPYFTQIHWTSDKGVDGIYPLSNSNPDLVYEFKYKDFIRRFAVECKYREKPTYDIQVAKPEQLTRYKAYSIEKGIQVYIALGIGGTPHNPRELFLLALDDCKSVMNTDELRNYSRSATNIWFYNKDIDRLT